MTNVNNVNNEPSEKKSIRPQPKLPQTKYSISKLGQKGLYFMILAFEIFTNVFEMSLFVVIGRNLVRSSSRYTVRQEAITLRQIALRHGSKLKPNSKVKKYVN